MKKQFLMLGLTALCLLTGCGGATDSSDGSATDESSQETSASVTDSTTPAQTTTNTTESSTSTTETTTPKATTTTVVTTTTFPAIPREVRLVGTDVLEVFAGVTRGEFIKDSNVTLQDAGAPLDTSTVGKHQVTVGFTYQGKAYQKTLSYTVQDTTPPVLLHSGSGTVIEQGKPFDLYKIVGFGDNYDRSPKLTYTGTVDTNTVGSYPLSAAVTDSCGNRTEWKLTVKVAEHKPTVVDTKPRMAFDSFVKTYGGAGKKIGIDVSKWQGKIDFQAVKKAGCDFVIMRIGYYRKGLEMDEYYRTNMAAAKAAGLEVGVYFYSTANNEKDVRAHAKWIAEQLGGQKLDFPVAFDWESFSNFQQYGMSIHDLNDLFLIFADEMKQHGYASMLYSSKSFLNNFWTPQTRYPVWLAHYTDQTDYTGAYAIWQASCRGRIPGIAGDVDLNILYTDRPLFG